ncbi:MAG: hypothetical protein LBN10_01130 [Propionibacteriaceae bacterium]|jgi:hypothetical protein|nr:hypothetical protein [Propionibacteriaceae bacterium]
MSSRRFSFVLPSDWWRIPLVSEEARTANIDHMVDHQFRNVDESSQLRHQVKEELHKQSTQAATVGGLVMAFYMLNIGEAPISATMTCYDATSLIGLPTELDLVKLLAHYVGDTELEESLPDLAETLFPDGMPSATDDSNSPESASSSLAEALAAQFSDHPEVLEALDRATEEGEDDTREEEPPPPWEKVTAYPVVAYRRERIDPGTDYFGEETTKVPQLQVTYAQAVPDFGIVQTIFSTPIVPLRDEWVGMFDAIIATFRTGSPESATEPTQSSTEPTQSSEV